ncbi:MAG: isoaspartyl peptidase/L-asparaginase [Oligoflexus sp.]
MERFGQHTQPFLILHGGAGPMDPSSEWVNAASEILIDISRSIAQNLNQPRHRLDIVEQALQGMESEAEFNAGRGAALQSDGQARVSAALMDGPEQCFSGVIGVCNVLHPSRMARHLQAHSSRVLALPGAETMARELGLPVDQLVTERRLKQWQERMHDAVTASDTVGAVFWHPRLGMAAGTSTGGRGFEYPGRVTDSATVAGNYASQFAAISATGIGEEIVDDAVAARLETRCRDGMSLAEASHRCYQEAQDRHRSYGWIAVDTEGQWAVATTTKAMTYVVMDGQGKILASSLTKP